MKKVQKRMLEILDSLPQNCCDNKSPEEVLFFLAKRYIEIYGPDETTIIPGTNKHLSVDDLPTTTIKI